MKWFRYIIVFCLSICLSGCQNENLLVVDEYDGVHSYVLMNENVPEFDDISLGLKNGEEYYSPLDRMDRCGMAAAKLGLETMPTQKRESIGMVKPSGWQISKYDHVDGQYLYNRCHLIGFQLSGENANRENLITGTRYFNVEGMLPFENMTAEYIHNTGNHVLYEVTPLFEGDDLVARGVQMQAQSIEDDGLSFNVFVYNIQPGVTIDYNTGNNALVQIENVSDEEAVYVLNMHSKKYHLPSCEGVKEIKVENRRNTNVSEEDLLSLGFEPAECCHKMVDKNAVEEYVINLNSNKFHKASCKQAKRIKSENKKEVFDTYQSLVDQGYVPSKCCN